MVQSNEKPSTVQKYDAVVVGAGFAGMYMLHRLRGQGLSVRVLEAGEGVGGTWYWNRYPGARCDVESLDYQYGFSDEIQRGWTWTERYAAQPEILRYQNYVADKLDLRRDIQFKTRVTAMTYDSDFSRWIVETDCGDRIEARFCVMATGCLSSARRPNFEGLDDFEGSWYHTGAWPHEGVDFTGKRVAVIGTGSSGIQAIPPIAEQADRLYVFQRTANFAVPSGNRPLDPEDVRKAKDIMLLGRQKDYASEHGVAKYQFEDRMLSEIPPEELQQGLNKRWGSGSFDLMGAYADLMTSREANVCAADFARTQMAKVVKDPVVADLLTPTDHPFGTKRLCIETGYLETFNKPHVSLIDVKHTPIEQITRNGIQLGEVEYEVDCIVFATGFDAMTGALLSIDIIGRDGVKLQDKWMAGARTYLGVGTAGFPNLFFITGPGSPSVLSNMIVAIEQHVDWINACIEYLDARQIRSIEPDPEAENHWVKHVDELANRTLYPQANSWYLGANIPGKPRIFLPYTGGVGTYQKKLKDVTEAGYAGFALSD